jgi:serine/threonine protein kinase
MRIDQTQRQSDDEELRSQALSLKRAQPPTQVPGYEPRRFLGSGAYGEVWVAIDRTTGRQVAIKFYADRGRVDWSLLSREVEKLAFLSADRYVVQLLDVGWDAEPPYYVMEYVEHGSLEDLLRREKKLRPDTAVAVFRDVAIGLLHAHAKGVLHCDLKPANVLLDQDTKPRLADFGQSRLSHEQTPALGTLFFMAPEQADLKATPDVRWDVYALGALLYAMLTGSPPYRDSRAVAEIETASDLDGRLARYRRWLERAPRPTAHRKIPGVDRQLADIVDGCLAVDRNGRFANVQAVLDALDARAQRRARRPLVLLGAVGPALVLLVMSFVAWRWFETVVGQSDETLRNRALESNHFAAQYIAKTVTNELDRRYRSIEEMAGSSRFQQLLAAALDDPDLTRLRRQLSDPKLLDEERQTLREQFLVHPARQALQQRLQSLFDDETEPPVASWFVTDSQGLHLARAPDASSIGVNYAWRTYFSGEQLDQRPDWRPSSGDHVKETNLSALFQSASTNRWSVAISAPVQTEPPDGKFLGVLAMAVDVDRFVDLQGGDRQFAVLVDWRSGPNKGVILQHPLFDKLVREHGRLPDRIHAYRLEPNQLPDDKERRENYVDPLAQDTEGAAFRRNWLAEMAPVGIREGNTGWVVIVQESYQVAIGRTLDRLKSSLMSSGVLAVALIAALSTLMWVLVLRVIDDPAKNRLAIPEAPPDSTL